MYRESSWLVARKLLDSSLVPAAVKTSLEQPCELGSKLLTRGVHKGYIGMPRLVLRSEDHGSCRDSYAGAARGGKRHRDDGAHEPGDADTREFAKLRGIRYGPKILGSLIQGAQNKWSLQ